MENVLSISDSLSTKPIKRRIESDADTLRGLTADVGHREKKKPILENKIDDHIRSSHGASYCTYAPEFL
jgi:hypothetical protein